MFLGSLSSTLNVVLAIPMSLLGTVAVIYFLGFTLNTFTLLALSLAVGIVVDDAIMVHGEHLPPRRDGQGPGASSRARAPRRSPSPRWRRRWRSSPSSCRSSSCAGIIGKFFLQFGVTLSVAVLLSYLEAITLAPAALRADPARQTRAPRLPGPPVDRAFDGLSRGLRVAARQGAALARPGGGGRDRRVLGRHPAAFRRCPASSCPRRTRAACSCVCRPRWARTSTETDTLFKRAEAFVNKRPEVQTAFAVVGGFGGAGVNTGIMFVTLKPPEGSASYAGGFAGVLRKELNSYPGLRAIVQDLSQAGFTAQRGFPVEFCVRGSDWDKLVDAVRGHDARSSRTAVW